MNVPKVALSLLQRLISHSGHLLFAVLTVGVLVMFAHRCESGVGCTDGSEGRSQI